jgi:hypothetical protein
VEQSHRVLIIGGFDVEPADHVASFIDLIGVIARHRCSPVGNKYQKWVCGPIQRNGGTDARSAQHPLSGGRHPGKSLNQCYALANAAYLLWAQHQPAHMVRAAIDGLRAAFEK